MLSLGTFFVAAGASMAVASLNLPRYRAVLEVIGGSLFVVGLGLAGAILTLAC
ncbi:hypothetical protein [Methylobacterium sp. CM6257]|jgi:hypothetical protein